MKLSYKSIGCATLVFCLLIIKTALAKPIPVIIDTDLASDDIQAITYILHQPQFAVKAITISSTGEVSCKHGLHILNGILTYLDKRHIPIACGQAKNFSRQPNKFPAIWVKRANNFLGIKLPTSRDIVVKPSATKLITSILINQITEQHTSLSSPHTSLSSPRRRGSSIPVKALDPRLHGDDDAFVQHQYQHKKTVLFVLGPWTNIAAVYRKNPQLFKNSIKAIYSADGILSANTINHEPGAKRKYFRGTWNLHIDPRAGQIVFASGVPIKLITTDARARLNPLSQLPIYEKQIRISKHQTNSYAKLVAMILKNRYAWFISDQVAAVAALYPQICRWKSYKMRINTKPRSHAGETVPDPNGNKIWLCLYIKKNLYQNLFINGLTNRK